MINRLTLKIMGREF
jgi:hypothetical protein